MYLSIRETLKEVDDYPLLSREEETEYILKAQAGDIDALHRLVMSNMKLVLSVVFRYAQEKNDIARDLIDYGVIGLIIAIKKFDLERGYKLSTYALCWITQQIRVGKEHEGRGVSFMRDKSFQFESAVKHIEQENKQVTTEELVKQLGWTKTAVESFKVKRYGAKKLCEDGNDLVFDPCLLANSDMSDLVKRCVLKLDHTETMILIRRYGLDGREPLVLKDTAKELNITPERVRQIENEALRKLFKMMYPIVSGITLEC